MGIFRKKNNSSQQTEKQKSCKKFCQNQMAEC